MKVALLIPDGVGVRNFVIGRFLKELAGRGRACAFHVVPERVLPMFQNGFNGSVEWRPLLPYRQSRAILAMQYSLGYAQMYWADTMAMRRVRSQRPRGSWQMKLLTHTTRAVGRLAASPARMGMLDRLHCRAVEKLDVVERYRETFRQTRPAVLFCSHQRPSAVLPPVLAARSLGIPTATFIFSWDNLSSKGRIAAPFDHYLVWSEHMRGELLRYYPDVAPERIHVVGTPQFEPYADRRTVVDARGVLPPHRRGPGAPADLLLRRRRGHLPGRPRARARPHGTGARRPHRRQPAGAGAPRAGGRRQALREGAARVSRR